MRYINKPSHYIIAALKQYLIPGAAEQKFCGLITKGTETKTETRNGALIKRGRKEEIK